jgi:hypothetical protein
MYYVTCSLEHIHSNKKNYVSDVSVKSERTGKINKSGLDAVLPFSKKNKITN